VVTKKFQKCRRGDEKPKKRPEGGEEQPWEKGDLNWREKRGLQRGTMRLTRGTGKVVLPSEETGGWGQSVPERKKARLTSAKEYKLREKKGRKRAPEEKRPVYKEKKEEGRLWEEWSKKTFPGDLWEGKRREQFHPNTTNVTENST